MSAEKTLRIVLLCHGTRFEAWEAAAIREVCSLPFVSIVLRVEEIPVETDQLPAYRQQKHALWRLHNRRKLKKISALQPVDLQAEIGQVPVLSCQAELKGKYSEHFPAKVLDTIRSHQPDLILRFAFNILRGEILQLAPYGVWSFHHADVEKLRGGPGAFWEIYGNDPVTGAMLQRLTEKLDGGIPLKQGWFPTIRHSYAANLDQLLMGTASWMKQVCLALHAGQSLPTEPVQQKAPFRTFPTNGQMIRFHLKQFSNRFRFHRRELFRAEQWNIGILDQPLEKAAFSFAPEKVRWLKADPSRYYKADPFGYQLKGQGILFYERYDYRTGKGHIEKQDASGEKIFLQPGLHLSYPYLLETETGKYMVPESFEAGEAVLYQLDPETAAPIRIASLLPFPAVDSSLIAYEGRWWIFCTHEDQGSNHNLFLYYADQIEGPYLPHLLNPVKTDIRSARPGGSLFTENGKLYRPAQDCSSTYGAALVIQEITALDPERFSEKTVRRLEPSAAWPYRKGLHTLSRFGDQSLVDAKRYVFNFDRFLRSLKRKLRLS